MMTSRIEALKAMLSQAPDDASLHYMLGLEYCKAQMHAQAVECLRRYLAQTDDEGAAYRVLAQSLQALGHLDETRQAYRDGLAAATRHGHQPMIEEYSQALHDLAEPPSAPG
jgi:predicted Zn-dependent protease